MIPKELKEYDYRENLIIDRDNPILIQKAWRDRFSDKCHWNAGYGGQAYLSKPNSEDALTWNVFRTLQIAGEDGLKVINAFGVSKVERILFWGCDVENRGDEQQLLNILIRTTDGKYKGTMTEPDLVLITEKEVVFVECKLNQNGSKSPWKAQGEGAKKRMETYRAKFPELNCINEWNDVYQLIRQYVYAKLLGEHLRKEPVIIPLINEKHRETLLSYYSKIKESSLNKENTFHDFATWQSIIKNILESSLSNREIISAKIMEALKYAR